MTEQSAATAQAVEETVVRPGEEKRKKPKRQPRYNVILWDDQDHTPEYVVAMMQQLFGYPTVKGLLIAVEVHLQGKAIVLTTTREHAELKRDQIHAFGKDPDNEDCLGSMWASIEPVPE